MAFDPLAGLRGDGAPEFDVLLEGTVFLDIIFAALRHDPQPGTEVYADGMASCPGGIANLAVATRRLGLRTSLAAGFGDDDYADFCWRTLEEQEGVDLSRSRRFEDWHSPVTVSLAHQGDRAMVTHAHEVPMSSAELIGDPPSTHAVLLDLPVDPAASDAWVGKAWERGAKIFADVGWDETEQWDPIVLEGLSHCYAFTPNAVEAMAYTRTATPHEALYAIADRVPFAVVTNGSHGALALDAETGEEAQVPALRVPAVDPTGAGDVFGASLVLGTLAGWPLTDRLAFSSLCSALTVQHYGGSLAAPAWGDIADWWHDLAAEQGGGSYLSALRRRFAFLEPLVAEVPPGACRRATATIGRRADVPGFA